MPTWSARSRWRARRRSPTSTRPRRWRRWRARSTGMSFDVAAVRRQFPILSEIIDGRPVHYLDNGASAQTPLAVLDAVRTYETTSRANVLRGVHRLAERATEAYENARADVAKFLGVAADGDRLHRRLHGGDQSRRLFLWPAAEARRPHPAVGARAPFQHRALAAPAAAQRRRARHDPGDGRRPDRSRGRCRRWSRRRTQADLAGPRLERHRRAARRARRRRRRPSRSAPR